MRLPPRLHPHELKKVISLGVRFAFQQISKAVFLQGPQPGPEGWRSQDLVESPCPYLSSVPFSAAQSRWGPGALVSFPPSLVMARGPLFPPREEQVGENHTSAAEARQMGKWAWRGGPAHCRDLI